ncbi:stress response protein [Desertimonas flava]|uniref:stress response protein n=1 Tax=Desertimonas flava TaxID=2064846 RepID=UPI001878163B|nr:stress response protein [Desertimonas flava]
MEENWQQARLIPTSGINGAEEAERRATSALLAVMSSVRDFAQTIVKPLGAPAGQLATFIEVPFALGEQRVYPDGLLRAARGGRTWTCLVEVKTGPNELARPQVEAYLDVAREQDFDCVLTISNQIAPAPGVHPIDVDRRKTKRVALHHLSWAEVTAFAVQHRVHRGVSDPEQAWILGELIRYLEHPKSGAMDFTDMGAAWVTVRESVGAGTLRATDKGIAEVVSRWEQLLRYTALRLGRELGSDVQVQLSRKELADPTLRFSSQAQSLVERGALYGQLRIPDAVAPIDVTADLRANRITASADIDAPRDGRATTRVNWLIRQLADAPDGLRVDAFVANARTSTSELLRLVRQDPNVLITDPKKDLRTFRVAIASALGPKRGTGRGGFIDSVLTAVDGFYAHVLQSVRPWSPRAPQLSKSSNAVEEAGIDITPPAKDLEELESEDRPPTGPSSPPDAVRVGVADSPADESEIPDPTDSGELVTWDDAQDRLDRERSFDSVDTHNTNEDPAKETPADESRGRAAELDADRAPHHERDDDGLDTPRERLRDSLDPESSAPQQAQDNPAEVSKRAVTAQAGGWPNTST